jgi:hypothetical protein
MAKIGTAQQHLAQIFRIELQNFMLNRSWDYGKVDLLAYANQV